MYFWSHVAGILGVAVAVLGCSGSDVPEAPATRVGPGTVVWSDFELALRPAFGGRRFEAPVEAGAYPEGRMFVAEQAGRVFVLRPDGSDEVTVLDIRSLADADKGEGLMSFALDPGFEANGYVWAYYFVAGESATVLSRFEMADGQAALDSELWVLHLEQPGYNQNGGAIRFGPDGMLYLSLGDGSASLDPFDNGQDLGTMLGDIVRIDVRGASEAEPYEVPPDNPFLERPGARGEIWAAGVRNPWRIDFDPQTGALWGGDVGVSDWEEVNRYEAGGNYGWNIREGFDCLAGDQICGQNTLIDPVAAYRHEDGRCSVIGGLVYRGDALPELRGKYLFGDFCSGEVFALDVDTPGAIEVVAEGAPQLTSFAVDENGRLYVTSLEGSVWEVVEEE